MPIPTPNSGEDQNTFVGRCMSVMNKEFPDEKQRSAICYSQWKKSKKESIFVSPVHGYELKEDNGNLVVKGYIATTHLDDGFYDEVRNVYVKDKITKETLDKWADEINQGIPRANKVSVNHKREPHVAGVGVKGSARVDKLPDGEYGLYVESFLDKTKDDFNEIDYRIKNDLIDSFSIEFQTRNILTGDYIDGAVHEEQEGNGLVRTLLPETELEGWTLASQPMNEHAIMLKEILRKDESLEKKEEEILINNNQIMEEKIKMTDATEMKFSPQELEEYKSLKEKEAKEIEAKEKKALVDSIKEELKESLKNLPVENKILVNKPVIENKEVLEYKEAFKSGIDTQFKSAGRLAYSLGMFERPTKSIELREFKNFRINNNKLEYKSLGVTTNQNTDTDYLLSGAELMDVFDPVIYNALNQKATTWNLLAKDDYSNKGNNQVQFTLKTVANASAGAYTGNAIATGNVGRLKYMTKFKKYQVGIEVDGDMIAAARGGPIGDVFAQEVKDSTDDLMSVMNADLFKEVGLETAAGVLGFEFIADSAGNTTMYSLTRSVTNKLNPDSATDTYINGNSAKITVGNLRKAIRQAINEGADVNNLVFVTDPIQYDMIKGLYDDLQRLVPTSSRFGFEGRIEFDGVPIFYDKDCNDDDVWLVDLETHRIAMWVPPTLEMLGKDADAVKGFIKCYWCTYNRAPRRLVMIYGNATS